MLKSNKIIKREMWPPSIVGGPSDYLDLAILKTSELTFPLTIPYSLIP